MDIHFFHRTTPFQCVRGETLPGFTLAWQSWGKLNEKKDNAILLFHALSGSQHVAGVLPRLEVEHDPALPKRWNEELQQGWWEDHVGPGKTIDTDRFFVICVNYLGGCYGSTGPASLNPETGKPWGSQFPKLTARDIVDSQLQLIDSLGIECLHAVVGSSVGGLLALTLATSWPERVRRVASLCSGVKTTVLNRLILLEQILAVENDPNFSGGDYYQQEEKPDLGLALARMISHKTFVHLDAIERRSRKDIIQPEDQFAWYSVRDKVESYMLHQGKKFVERFDANTYLRIIEMWSGFDPVLEGQAKDEAELYARSREAGHKYLVFSIDSDFCFYPEEQANLVQALEQQNVDNIHITAHSAKGHDSFLVEPWLLAPHLEHLLR